MNEHDTTNRDRVIRLNIRGGAKPETLAEFYGLSVDAVLRIARDDRPQTPRKAYTAEEAIQLARANALNERALHELRFELVRLQVGVETLAEENRVLKLANATLARRLDDALGPAWERREGERE